MLKITVEQAMATLKQAMKDEPDYAYGWHCNIAMMCTDAMVDAKKSLPMDSTSDFNNAANEGASRFMKLCFDVETSKYRLTKTMTPAEALYGFMGWLTSRDEVTPELSAKHDAGVAAQLVAEFCTVNNLDFPRDGWENNLIHPSGECSGPAK